MKGEPYEALLRLTEAELKELCPFGAVKVSKDLSKDRWEPAEKGKAHKTLAKLLKDKKDRIETVRLLHRDSTRGYTDNPALSMRPDVGQAVDKETQERFTKEARERFGVVHAEEQQRAALRSYLGRLRAVAIEQIKAGNDPGPTFETLLRQLEAKERKAA